MTRSISPDVHQTARLADTGMLRLAAIDIGSNSLHMAIAQADPDGGVTTLWRIKEMIGLGRLSFPSHRLSRQAMDRALLMLHRFVHEARVHHCEKILAIATSAVREAHNGGDFMERAQRELGVDVRVVSAREEARLIYLGVRHAVDLKGGPHLILDVGGGSVELIVADKDRPLLLESRKLGAARMTAAFVKSDPIKKPELKALLAHYDQELTPVVEQIRALRPVRVLGTSGTLENIAAMCGNEPPADNAYVGGVINRGDFSRLLERLTKSDGRDRAKMRGLDEPRRDQVLAGALLVGELFRLLDIKEIRICRAALREGILVDYLSRHLPELEIRRHVPDPRRRSVLDLARRCDWYQSHREQVSRLCLRLFDKLKPLHKMDRRQRELLEYGALLHEVGWYISKRTHHKHSMYLILNGDLKGFTQEEIAIIANIARYHRKSLPKASHQEYAQLSPAARRTVRAAAMLLRLADALDRSHGAVVSDVHCRIGKNRVQMTIETTGDAELELWAARRQADAFARIFRRRLTPVLTPAAARTGVQSSRFSVSAERRHAKA